MKIFVHMVFHCCLLTAVIAQDFPVDTLIWNGNISNRINLVILADGYTTGEFSKFRNDAQKIVADLFDTSPLKEYQGYFNVFTIEVASNESGATHPGTATDVTEPVHPVITVDNYFGSTFDFGGIHRLLVPTNSQNLNVVLASSFPSYDQAFVLTNSPFYGGSGGTFATASTDQSASEVAIHEIGHSFANLADEYWAGDQYARETHNMTQVTDPNLVKWNNWINILGIGIYPHGNSGIQALWYKPHQNCKMRILNVPFCAVCSEAFVNRIYQLVFPLENYSYPNGTVDADKDELTFTSELLQTTNSSNYLVWDLNGESLDTQKNEITIFQNMLLPGENLLTLSLFDTTSLSKTFFPNSGYLFQVNWTIRNQINSGIIETTPGIPGKFTYRIFPNPINDIFTLKYENHLAESQIQLNLYNLSQQEIWSNKFNLSRGKNQIQVSLKTLPPGGYILQLIHKNFHNSVQITKL